MEQLQEWGEVALAALPRIGLAIGLFVAAIVVAKVVRRGLRGLLQRIRFDAVIQRTGMDAALGRVGLRKPLSELLPQLAYVLLLVLFLQTGAEAVGIAVISTAIGGFLAYLPNLFAAVVLLLVGSWASKTVGDIVARAAAEAGIDFAPSLGNLVSALILFVVGLMALGQLQIDTEIVRIVTICGLGGMALAFGLSFGLGTREITRDILAGFYARKVLRAGRRTEVDGQSGILRGVTATSMVLDREGETIVIANSKFMDTAVRQEAGRD
jgi:hypothetical protein